MKSIATGGNTVVPALLTLEALGFAIESDGRAHWQAHRDDEIYRAEDPVALLGLVQLVATRGWNWSASDAEIHNALQRFNLE
jgi:hypothetical protein